MCCFLTRSDKLEKCRELEAFRFDDFCIYCHGLFTFVQSICGLGGEAANRRSHCLANLTLLAQFNDLARIGVVQEQRSKIRLLSKDEAAMKD